MTSIFRRWVLMLVIATIGPVLLMLQAEPAYAAGSAYTFGADPLPVAARAGDQVQTTVRFSNDQAQPLSVSLKIVPVDAHNDGVVVQSSAPANGVVAGASVQPRASANPGQTTDIVVSVNVPTGTAPDVYLIGLLVTPDTSSAEGVVNNQLRVLQHVAISVLGPTNRLVDATPSLKPGLLVGRSAKGSLTVQNTGSAGFVFSKAVEVKGEAKSAGAVSSVSGAQQEVLLTGLNKTFTYKWKAPTFFMGRVHPVADVNYDDDGVNAVKHFSGSAIWVVTPVALVVGLTGLAVIAAVAILAAKRLRKRSD